MCAPPPPHPQSVIASYGPAVEGESWHDWNIVDWDFKPKHLFREHYQSV